VTGPAPFAALAAELIVLLEGGVDRPLSDDAFNEWALRVFRYQLATNPLYRRFAEGRGVGLDGVGHWTEVPAVPTRAFKHVPLVSGDPRTVRRLFRTSGTSEGEARRGEHHVLEPALYRAAVLPNFKAHMLPDRARLPILSLIPSPADAPDSSLSHMIGIAVEEVGGEGSSWFLAPGRGIDDEGLMGALRRAEKEAEPVLVVATAFALVHWLEAMGREGWTVTLPDGSRVMETGGFKGRTRAVPKQELYEAVQERMGVPGERIVNEYGMTELLSQFYEDVLRKGEAVGGPGSRHHRPPPWVRTRVLNPTTLDPCAPGEAGILCHYDLANAGSVSSVLTEDLGVAVGDGFRLVGRSEGAEPRGCSLAMDDILVASRA